MDLTAISLEIPHEQFQLANGLQVVLHCDRRLPSVVINVLYLVGSRLDPPDARGLAHLAEHLMFMGTRGAPEGQFDLLMERGGGWNNAFTTEDLTVYLDVGPASLLETMLWLEADRMATLPAGLTRAKLDLQRSVVLGELRQEYENVPYGEMDLRLPGLLFPSPHGYSWPIIGARADIEQIELTTVKEHFRRYYTPRNAILVIAGDFDPGQARELARRHFRWVKAAGPAREAAGPGGGASAGAGRWSGTDQVTLPKLVISWRSPAHFAPGDAELDLAAEMLAEGKQSRLHRALVLEQELALKVAAYQDSRHQGSQFSIEVTGRAGVEPRVLERAVMAVVRDYCAEPPGARELTRAQHGYAAHYVDRLQKLSRRAELLCMYWAVTGRPDSAARDMARYLTATPGTIQRWSKDVLRPGHRCVASVVSG